MSDNQQFCLRWNNHQSTLVQVIDSLLSSGVLVDCTLAAEGQYLHAHKVVLCACSPYLETLLSQHYEKHPIVILKDVKFQELKSMMDYMYKGEVNISQDQLGQFLKAAESLQIKGLTDGGGGENDSKDVGSTSHKRHDPPPIRKSVPPNTSRSSVVLPSHGTGLTIEPSKRSLPSHLSESQPDSPIRSREGSSSPTPRKRRRPRRPSQGDDDGHQDNCDLPMQQQSMLNTVPIIPQLPAGSSSTITKAPPPDDEPDQPAESDVRLAESGLLKEKIEPQSELLIEPKTEYMEETNNDDSVEDLTLDDDDEYDNMDAAGPSHGGDNSNQSYGQWQMGDRTHDEVFMAAQEAVGGGPRDSQGKAPAAIYHSKNVDQCQRSYRTEIRIEWFRRLVKLFDLFTKFFIALNCLIDFAVLAIEIYFDSVSYNLLRDERVHSMCIPYYFTSAVLTGKDYTVLEGEKYSIRKRICDFLNLCFFSRWIPFGPSLGTLLYKLSCWNW